MVLPLLIHHRFHRINNKNEKNLIYTFFALLFATFSRNCATQRRKKTQTSVVALQLFDGGPDYVLNK